MEKYLPLGSVVRLHGGEKNVMIYGRRQRQVDNGDEWDYVACLHPEGNIGEEFTYLFNHDQIDRIIFLGLTDEDEIAYAQYLAGLTEEASES